jgi:hypothetical protein
MTGSAAITEDGLTVVYSAGAGCTAVELTAEESATRVTLTLSESDDSGLADCATAPGFPSTAEARLHAPLDGRPLVDSVSGRSVPYLSETDMLRPQFPMKDWETYTGAAADPWSEVTTTMSYFGGPDTATLVENFQAVDTIGQLAIVQTTGGWHPPPGTTTTPVTVRGQRGLAARGIIVWTESERTIAVLGSRTPPSELPVNGRPERDQPGTPFFNAGGPLTTAQLLDIAATLVGRP